VLIITSLLKRNGIKHRFFTKMNERNTMRIQSFKNKRTRAAHHDKNDWRELIAV
jgi:hypothetical protein